MSEQEPFKTAIESSDASRLGVVTLLRSVSKALDTDEFEDSRFKVTVEIEERE